MNKNQEFNLELKIGLFGNAGVGKTTIIIRFLSDIFVKDYEPNIEEAYRKIIDLNNGKILLDILDTSGAEEYLTLICTYIRDCDAIALVYSIIDKYSFQHISEFNEKIKECFENDEIKENYPKILIGNKSDLFTKRVVKTKEGKELAKKLNCKYIETSAKTGENVNQLFYEVSLLAIEELKKKENENQNQKNQNKKKKGKCLLM